MPSDNERGFVSVLNNRNFVRLWIAQTIGLTSQNGIHFVQMVLIEHLTGSTTHMGLMILAFSIPGVLFSAVAGVVVDRLPRKLVLDVSNVLRILAVLSYVVVLRLLDGWQELIALYAVTFVISSISQFFAPALWAEIPRLIGEDRLLAANNLFNLTYAFSQAAGMIILAPLAVKIVGIEGSVIAIALSYVVSTVLIALIPGGGKPEPSKPDEEHPFRAAWQDLREGWDFVAQHRGIYLPMVQLTLIATLIMVMAMLAPGFATRVLGMAPEDAFIIFAPSGVGMVLSTFVLGRFFGVLKRETWVNTSLLATTVGFGLLGLISMNLISLQGEMGVVAPAPFSMIVVIMVDAFLIGFFLATANTVAQTSLQERSPAYIRGRVYAVQFLLANLVGIPPLIGLGGVADYLGIPVACYVLAALILATWAMSSVLSSRLHRSEVQSSFAPQVEADRKAGRRRVLIIASLDDDGTRRSGEALAHAFSEYPHNRSKVLLMDGFDLLHSWPALLGKAIRVLRRRFPFLRRLTRELILADKWVHAAIQITLFLSSSLFRHALLCYRPDVIIVMQPFVGRLLSETSESMGLRTPVISIVTDLIALSPAWLCPKADLYIVATQAAYEKAVAGGVPASRVRNIGLPVDPRLADMQVSRSEIRSRLDWPADRRSILLVNSGSRNHHFFHICLAIARRRLPLHLALVAGRDVTLVRRLMQVHWDNPTDFYGYVEDLPEMMRGADLLVTYAGSHIVAESLASGLPMLLVDEPGRHEENVAFVVGAGVGIHACDPEEIADILTEWFRPENLGVLKMAQQTRMLARPHSAKEIVHLIFHTLFADQSGSVTEGAEATENR